LSTKTASLRFGILPGHADFLTSLTISVVSWKSTGAILHFCAVRRGVFSITGGQAISIATREAILGNDLTTLDQKVLTRFRADIETDRMEHVGSTQLQLNAIRRIMLHLRPDGRSAHGNFA
jgi:F-type H+-transporting ATPase subunit epsilon